jgi:hypothetical protein
MQKKCWRFLIWTIFWNVLETNPGSTTIDPPPKFEVLKENAPLFARVRPA